MPAKTRKKKNQLDQWVKKRFPVPRRTPMTAADLARIAAKSLGARVNTNTMCRALRRAGVKFKADPLDPISRHYSKVDLLKARVDFLERRLSKVEKTVKRAA